jgi:molybdopterin-dependent oxidoreductase alpha subunit
VPRVLGAALSETIGVGKGTVTLEDIADHAELIVIAGQNPGTNHPRMLTALEQAKRRGARIVAVNPLPEAGVIGRFRNPQTPRGLVGPGTQIADRLLPMRVNGDLALFNGLNRVLLDREDAAPGTVFDHEFIERYCDGLEAAGALARAGLAAHRAAQRPDPPADRADADDVIAARSVIVCWAMGLTQHRNAVPTIREIVNFLLLRGNIGRPGAGPCPVRGHSNVQGDRTMGIWEKMPDAFLDALRDEFGFEPPRAHGMDTVDSIRAMRDGRIDVFVALGGNFAPRRRTPRSPRRRWRTAQLTVHIATKLNRSHLCTAARR